MYEMIGVWCVVLLTLSIFSYLYGDNPFYKAAEHIFVGVSAGYIFTITFWDTIWPNLFGRLFPDYVKAGFEFDWTSKTAMSKSRSMFRTIESLAEEFLYQKEKK